MAVTVGIDGGAVTVEEEEGVNKVMVSHEVVVSTVGDKEDD